jgi:hypothetical protein
MSKQDTAERLIVARNALESILSQLDPIPSIIIKVLNELDDWDRRYARDYFGRSMNLGYISKINQCKTLVNSYKSLYKQVQTYRSKVKLAFDSSVNDTESGRD